MIIIGDTTTLNTDSIIAMQQALLVNKDTVSHKLPESWNYWETTNSDFQKWFFPDSLDNLTKTIFAPFKHTVHSGITLPFFPQNELWVFLLLFGLLVLATIAIRQHSGVLNVLAKPFQTSLNRRSIFEKKIITEVRYKAYLLIFSISVISFFAHWCTYNNKDNFTFTTFALFFLTTSAFIIFKSVSIDILSFVFFNNKTKKIFKDTYFSIINLIGITLFPVTVSLIYIDQKYLIIPVITSYICLTTGAILVIIKLFQFFFEKTLASFYIMLYLCTLEILPLITLYQWYHFLQMGVKL